MSEVYHDELAIAYCENCDYKTGTMYLKDLIFKVSMDGGYIHSDKEGGYYSLCPQCQRKDLVLET